MFLLYPFLLKGIVYLKRQREIENIEERLKRVKWI